MGRRDASFAAHDFGGRLGADLRRERGLHRTCARPHRLDQPLRRRTAGRAGRSGPDRRRSRPTPPTRRFPSSPKRHGGFATTPSDAETVVDLNPDLVLAGRFTKRETRDILGRLGYRVVELLDRGAQHRRLDRADPRGGGAGRPPRSRRGAGRRDRGGAEPRTIAAATAAPSETAAVYQRRGYVTGADTLTGELMAIGRLHQCRRRARRQGGGFVPLERIVAEPPQLLIVGASAEPCRGSGERPPRASGARATLPAREADRAAREADRLRRSLAARRRSTG